MRLWIIEPGKRTARPFECEDVPDAKREAGLDGVDHGVVARGIGIVVNEYGLYENPDKTPYFRIGAQLYAGNAVLYGYDESGETVDLPAESMPEGAIEYFAGKVEIEAAIMAGRVKRPQAHVNGVLKWAWPNQDKSWLEEDFVP